MLPFSHEMFPRLMSEVPQAQWFASMHVVRRDGTVRSGGDAVIELLTCSPRTKPLAWLARVLPPVRSRIRREYEKMASSRGERSANVPDVEAIVDPPRLLRP